MNFFCTQVKFWWSSTRSHDNIWRYLNDSSSYINLSPACVFYSRFWSGLLKILSWINNQPSTPLQPDWFLTKKSTADYVTLFTQETEGIGASPKKSWVGVCRLRIGVGFFRATIRKWEMASTPICEFGVVRSNWLITSKHLLPSTRTSWNKTLRIFSGSQPGVREKLAGSALELDKLNQQYSIYIMLM